MARYEINIVALKVKNDKKVNAIKPDKDGVYRGLPAFVIGKGSRSTDYENESFYRSIVDNNSSFRLRITEGNCEGEWGHPFLAGSPEEQIKRLFHIERTRICQVITGLKTVPLESGDTLGLIDVVPTGPGTFGPALVHSLENPNINTAWSMRTFCHPPKQQPNGRFLKSIKDFITIDAEGTPGWEEASKRYRDGITISSGMESLNLYSETCSANDVLNVIKEQKILGTESKNQQLFDIIKSDSVILENTSYIIDISNKTLLNHQGMQKNIFHTCFGKR